MLFELEEEQRVSGRARVKWLVANVLTLWLVILAVACTGSAAHASPAEKAVDEHSDGPYVAASPTLGKKAEHFVAGCELYLFGEFVEPQVHPNYGPEKGYVIEKTETDVRVNGVLYFSLLAPTEPPAPSTPESKRFVRIYTEVIRQLQEHVVRREADVTLNGQAYDFGETITFEPKGLDELDAVPVTFRTNGMLIHEEGGGVVAPYTTPAPLTDVELARVDAVRLDKVYSILLRKLRPGILVLAGKIYIDGYSFRLKAGLMSALERIPKLAEVQYVKSSGEPYYKPLTIDGFYFDSPLVADFVDGDGGGWR